MNNYAEICQAYVSAKNNYHAYLQECNELAKGLWKAIIAYYDLPKDKISLHIIDELGEIEAIKPPVKNAMHLRADGFFEFGIGITLCDSEDAEDSETLILPIHIAIDSEGTKKIRLGEYGNLYELKDKKKASFHDFLDQIFKSVTESYREGLKEIRTKNSTRTIGFKA